MRRLFRTRRIVEAPTRRPHFHKLALDPLVAPGRILSGELADQLGDVGIYRWATGAVGVGPLLRDQSAMPAKDGGRRDESTGDQGVGEASAERAEQGTVGPVQTWLGVRSPQHRDLVAQHEQFGVLRRR
jgi:hypothetical protein